MIFIFPDGIAVFDDEYEAWMGEDYITVSEECYDVYGVNDGA